MHLRLPWLINRLRCMSAEEVAYRIGNSARVHWLSRLHGSPRDAAKPDSTVTGARWFAGDLRQSDLQGLCDAVQPTMRGRFRVLALGTVELGRPPQWLRDPKTGVLAPLKFGLGMRMGDTEQVGDIKYLWEPSRHLWLVPMAQAYHSTGEAQYLQGAVDLLQSWLEQNPHPLGPHWSSSLEAGIRLINWSAAWHLLGGDTPGSQLAENHPAFTTSWLQSIHWHLHFVSRNLSAYSSANNHLVGELAGLYVGLCTWPRWRSLNALRPGVHLRVQQEALLQNAPDGVNREQATSYQQFVLDFLLIAGLCARAEGEDFSGGYWSRLEAMCGFIAALMDSGGHVPQIGDADDGVACGIYLAGADNFSSLLATGAVLFKRGDYAVAAGELDAKTAWLLGQECGASFDRLRASGRPMALPVQFEEGGYAVLGQYPSGPREVRIVFDAGPLGYLGIAAHGHADALSVLLSVAGQPVLVDPGMFSYLANPIWRQHFRSTAAHNTIEVDGRSQSISGGPFMWTHHADARWVRYEAGSPVQTVVAEHSGYTARGKPLTHRRTVTFDASRSEILVTDELLGSGHHDLCLRWHVSEDLRVELMGQQAVIDSPRLTVCMELPAACVPGLVRAQDDSPIGWVSHRFEQRCASIVIECRATAASLPLTWMTRIHCDVIAG